MDAKTPTPKTRIASRFIPLTRQAVVADLCRDPKTNARNEAFALLAQRLQRHRGHDYRVLAEELRRVYLPFSPDRDTVRALTLSEEERKAAGDRLAVLITKLLERANYQRLTTEEADEILSAQNPYSLRIEVDLKEYDELAIFTRDTYETQHSVRRPETLYLLKATYDVRIYRRLFVFLKLKSNEDRAQEIAQAQGVSLKKAHARVRRRRKGLPDGISTDHVYVKVFKDMAQHDLQILFPLRTVQFRPFDKVKFYATAGGGTAFGAFSAGGKLLAATNPIAAAGTLVAFVGLVGRQIAKFFNQRNLYMMELAQKLFFHNLANNRAAVTLLLDRAEEEDVKEDLITLYFFGGGTFSDRELAARKRELEETIAERYGAAVDFELDDALRRLEIDGVVTRGEDTVTVLPVAEAAKVYAQRLDDDDVADAAHLCDAAPAADMMEA